MFGPAVICGAGIGAGLALLASAIWPQRPALAELLDRLHHPATTSRSRGEQVRGLLAAPAQRAGLPTAAVARDLAAANVDRVSYLAGQLALTILAGLGAPTFAWLVLGWDGPTPLWLSLIGACAGWWYARTSLHQDAERERTRMRQALSVLLSLMSVSLARGAGIEQAIDEAAGVCAGPAADRITSLTRTARLTRRPPWQALGDLGRTAGVADLVDLAAVMDLAGTDGARIRTALTARAAAMRATATAAAHTEAHQATARMSLPLILLACSYLVFLMYAGLAALQLTTLQ